MMHKTDVCIVGAGPAGATLSHFLSKENIEHVLLDKSVFPRDKVCGDGITVDVLNVLKRIDPVLQKKFVHESEMQPSHGLCFHGGNGRELRYDFSQDGFVYSPFFTSRRLNLDDFLVKNLPQGSGRFMPGTKVTSLKRDAEGVDVFYENASGEGQLRAKIIIGAEGEKPIVTRHLGLPHFRKKKNLVGAIRVYYKNVKGLHEGNHLEFFLDKHTLPGYFWIFPLSNNEVNVGLGMVSSAASKKKVNLKKALEILIETHPRLREMFAEAEPLETPQGCGLPLITSKRKIAGERYALIGDAAGMIEPFTGKGIGPGMMSARICSEYLVKALLSKDYDLKDYERHIYRYYRAEMKFGYSMQRILRHPVILNALIDLGNFKPVKKWMHQKVVQEWQKWM